jgi:hypothetical protein
MDEITEQCLSVAEEQLNMANEMHMVWNTSTFLEDHKIKNKVYKVITGCKRVAAILAPSQSATQHQRVKNHCVRKNQSTEEREKPTMMIYCEKHCCALFVHSTSFQYRLRLQHL